MDSPVNPKMPPPAKEKKSFLQYCRKHSCFLWEIPAMTEIAEKYVAIGIKA